MKIREIKDYIESTTPLSLQEDYDNCGLLVGNEFWDIENILVCLDCTKPVVQEAIEKNCQLIIAHHPPIFHGIKQITGSNDVEQALISAIKHDIAIYALHTNLDNSIEGVNKKIADKIGLHDLKILRPQKDKAVNVSSSGAGMVGLLTSPVTEIEFLNSLKATFRVDCIKHTALRNKLVAKVAICGGAGSFLLADAIREKADFYVSSDFKYHEFFNADHQVVIADIGHYESEFFTTELIKEMLMKKFPKFVVLISETTTNPVHYFI